MGLLSISNVVDVNNYFSLKRRLPASVIAGSLVTHDLIVREGRPGETYVFNSSGQELRLEGLLCLSTRDGVALASPVKDALAAHVTEKSTSAIACIYGSLDLLSEDAMADLVEEYASLITEHTNARTTDKIVVMAPSR
jgi:DNA/RNA-binding domain of Phe-tRNA-synthetase-like protein